MRRSQDLWVSTTPDCMYNRLDKLPPWRLVSRKRYAKTEYVDCTCTLDIESYNTKEDGWIYSIQLNIRGINMVVRYVEDLISLLERLIDALQLGADRRLVLYIHNLGYEQYYLYQILSARWGLPDILLTKPHKPLYVRWDNGIELRDSLKLFQKSLARLTAGLPHAKLSGDLDYQQYRTPDTPLPPRDWNYTVNDVQGLYEGIERLKQERGYNQATIPLTNTSMVIQEVNKRCREDGKVKRAMDTLRLDKEQMRLAYLCMAGGDTHGTRWRAGRTYYNCNSYDLKSAHPSQQILDVFPAGKPLMMEGEQSEALLREYINGGYGWLGRVFVRGFRIRPNCPDPTISISKCEDTTGEYGEDNGRLLGADGAIVYMDSNDYLRFVEAYNYTELIGMEIMTFFLKPLPSTFRGAVMDFFRVKESAEDGPERDFSKICVNAIFGGCAQKTIRDEYTLALEDMTVTHTDWETNLEGKEEAEVYKSQTNKFPFLWGLWTASLTRLKLWNLIKVVGWDKVIYWDTDSCKYEGAKVPEVDTVYNARIREQCQERGAVVINRKGKTVYIGSAEDEHPDVDYGYRAYRFLHAKCYAAEAWDKHTGQYEIETTIAGVGKEYGKAAMRGDIDNLANGLYIPVAGGLKLQYMYSDIMTRTCWSRPTQTASWIYMEDRDYEVNGKPLMIEQEVMVQ